MIPVQRLVRLAIGIGPLLCSTPVAAQSPWARQVENGLQRVTRTLRDDGYHEVDGRRGLVLNTGETASFTLTLHRGVAYVLVGVCDEDCAALQLALFADNDYEVEGARAPTSAPMVRLTPRQTGSYRVQVVMATCHMNPCWSGVALYGK